MKLVTIGANQHVLKFKNGSQILFSYETPVAGWSPLLGYFKTDKQFSTSTTRHINDYVRPRSDVVELAQEDIEALLDGFEV